MQYFFLSWKKILIGMWNFIAKNQQDVVRRQKIRHKITFYVECVEKPSWSTCTILRLFLIGKKWK